MFQIPGGFETLKQKAGVIVAARARSTSLQLPQYGFVLLLYRIFPKMFHSARKIPNFHGTSAYRNRNAACHYGNKKFRHPAMKGKDTGRFICKYGLRTLIRGRNPLP